MYYIWKLAEIPHTRWSGPACSSPWTTHAATERANKQSRHHPKSPMSRSNAKAAGEFTCQWRGSASCHCWTPPGSQLHLLKVRRWGNTLDYHTIAAPAIYCKVSNAFLKASQHSSRHSPSPDINHPASAFCSVSSWGTEGSSAWLIFNSATAVLFFADPPQQQWQDLCCQLWFSGGLYSTRQGAVAGQHSAESSPKARLSLQAQSWGQNPEGELGSTAPTPAVTCPKVRCRATSIQGFLLANGSWVPGCCCIVCSRHT